MLKIWKKISFVLIILFLVLCNSRVYAAEIMPMEYNNFSDNMRATVYYATPTKDGGMVSIAAVGPDEYGLNITNSSYVTSLVKLDSNQDVEWVYTLESYNLAFTDIVVDDDNIVVVGSCIEWGLYSYSYDTKFLIFNL